MHQILVPRLLILSVVTLLTTACGYHSGLMSGPATEGDSISVTGSGEVQVVHDRFRVRAVASREGDDINQMKQAVDQEVADTLALARGLGIEEKHLRAATLSVQPQWEWQPERRMVGYRVSRDIDITTDGIDIYAQLLDGMTRIGLSEVQPAGSESRDEESARQRAMAAAVENARARASALAQAAGRQLGPVLNIQVQQNPRVMPLSTMKLQASESTGDSWTPGEATILQEVQVRFRLE